jgi:hypothetical protein
MLNLSTVQDTFVRRLPALRKMARISFRHLPPEAKEESITNAIGLAWKAFYFLFRKGRAGEPGLLDSCLRYSIRQCRAGRLPQGCPRKKDTLAPRWVGPTRLDDFDPEGFVSRSTPIPDAVIFRVDVAEAFFSTLSDRQRKMAVDLAGGMSTSECAAKYKLSAGRISQFRREFKTLLDAFLAD